ncbi:MAG: HEAT repeat domain-containing protein, partial [bacterium]
MAQIIHLYRPQRTEAENLEAIFVARQPLLQDILDRLRKWRRCGSRQHYLIIGPRGIGKTNLVRLIEHRIHHDPDLSRIWCPISLSEEAYGITNVADLFVEALRILSEETSDSVLGHCYERIRFDNDDTRVIDLSLDAFRNYCKNSSVGILLILENVNRLFERPRRQRSVLHLLRKILIEEEWLTTICTSATYLNAVTKPEEPLFEFFQVHVLSELTPDEQLQLLHKLAILEKRVDLENKLPKFRSQLRALYHFTGGNPRLTIMLYDLIANQNITDVKTELDRLLDQLTPFYQDRMKDIPEQEAKLLETMALMSEGCTPTELANQARMQRKVVRALLTRLAKAGYLRAEERRRKRTVYIIPERFFRIWHQMNHSRQARGRVQYLLEFFSNWYATKEERDKIWDELTAKFQEGIEQQDETPGDDIAEYMMYIAAVSQGGEKFQREFDRLRNIAKVAGAEVIQEELAMLDEEYDSDGDYFVHKGYFLANDLNRHEEALSAFQKAFELSQGDIAALFNQAVALEKMGRTYKAKKIYEDCVALLIGQAEYGAIEETTEVLLHVLGQDSDSQRARMAALLLGRMPDKSMVEELINFLNSSQESWRRRYCATALGQIGAEPAVEPLIECLKDEA